MDAPLPDTANSRVTAAAVGRRRRRWTLEERSALIAAWRQSGTSKASFCRERGLCYSNFVRWLAEETGAGMRSLVEVRMEEAAALPGANVELVAPNGWRVRLGRDFAGDNLRKILLVVSQC
jgi:transposase-like protein